LTNSYARPITKELGHLASANWVNFCPQDRTNFCPQDRTDFCPQDLVNFCPQDRTDFCPQDRADFCPQNLSNFCPQGLANWRPQNLVKLRPQVGTSCVRKDRNLLTRILRTKIFSIGIPLLMVAAAHAPSLRVRKIGDNK